MWLALALGIFAAVLALIALIDLGFRLFADHGAVGGYTLPVWRAITIAALIALLATVAIWLLTLTLTRVTV